MILRHPADDRPVQPLGSHVEFVIPVPKGEPPLNSSFVFEPVDNDKQKRRFERIDAGAFSAHK